MQPAPRTSASSCPTPHLPEQELEKFKFVLDYKIKELKKQIEPREEEIAGMKEQIKEVGVFSSS